MQLPLKIEPATGLIAGARQVLSPFFDARPTGIIAELIVVHGISMPPGEFGGSGIDRLFTGNLPKDGHGHPAFKEVSTLRVSAHVVIRRDGEIVQYVPFGQRAWHAGQSHYRGRAACNDFSIGIELEGTAEVPYTEPQYHQLAALVEALLATYPSLSADHIAGHNEIAPGRKTDPWGTFDWEHWRTILRASGQVRERRRR